MAFSGAFTRPFRPAFDAGLAAGNGLLNSLIAYWPLNEASGNALDAHTNGLVLTDTNTVTNAAGKVYATARQYTAANSESHTRASEALLSAGDVELTLCAWIYANTKTAGMAVLGKYNNATGEREYGFQYDAAVDRLQFLVGNNTGSEASVLHADNYGAMSTGQWLMVIGWHDPAKNKIFLSVNNGAVNEVAHINGIVSGTRSFLIGARFVAGSMANYWNGRIGPVAMWKSAAGGGGVLSNQQRSQLYNAGAGLAYSAFTA